MQSRREPPDFGRLLILQAIDIHTPTTSLQGHFNGLNYSRWLRVAESKTVGDDVQHLSLSHFNRCMFDAGLLFDSGCALCGILGHAHINLSLSLYFGVAAHGQPLFDLLLARIGGQLHWKGYDQTRVLRSSTLLQLSIDGIRRVVTDSLTGFAIEEVPGSCEQKFQMIVELGHRSHGRA